MCIVNRTIISSFTSRIDRNTLASNYVCNWYILILTIKDTFPGFEGRLPYCTNTALHL